MDEEIIPLAPSALGPGDDHPQSPAGAARGVLAPLGPGDDDPRSPAQATAVPPCAPLGPGDASGHNPDDAFDYLVTSPPGPGANATAQRHLVRMPKPTPSVASIAAGVVDPIRRARRSQQPKE